MLKFKQPAWFDALLLKKHQTESITFKHNTIYVTPSKEGVGFLGIAALNFVLGINYQNNLILAVSYLMVMLLILSLLYAYANFNGLMLKVSQVHSDFASKKSSVTFEFKNDKTRYDIRLEHQSSKSFTRVKSLVGDKFVNFKLPLPRGVYKLGRYKIYTHYPFGLVTVWSYLISDQDFYVYPSPLETEVPSDSFILNNHGDEVINSESLAEDFNELKTYQKGMNIHRISWRHFAKTNELLIKDYQSSNESCSYGFDFDKLSGTVEERLSQLCFLVQQAEIEQQQYALKLPNKLIQLGSGQAHKIKCLEALSEV